MANAIILHRRRNEKIEPGSQTFTGNGVFVAPYSAEYTIIIKPHVPSAGNGGDGESARIQQSLVRLMSGGGGGGGGGVSNNYSIKSSIYIYKGKAINITVNNNISSFGNDISVSNGTVPQDGTDANMMAKGSGGAGEGKHTVIAPNGWSFNGQDGGSSGTDGQAGQLVVPSTINTAHGGVGGNGGDSGGGAGGTGGNVHFDYGMITYDEPTSGKSGSPAVTGSITISWGGN